MTRDSSPERDLDLMREQIKAFVADYPQLRFSPDILDKINVEDTAFLKERAGISTVGHPLNISISGIYMNINRIFVEELSAEEASAIRERGMRGLRQVQEKVPLAPLFLIVAEAWISSFVKKSGPLPKSSELFRTGFLNDRHRQSGLILSEELIRQAEKLATTLESLMTEARDREVCPESGLTLPDVSRLPQVAAWVERHGFQEQLHGFLVELRAESTNLKRRSQSGNSIDIPGRAVEDTSQHVHEMLGAAKDLIKKHWKVRAPKQQAITLFLRWGIEVSGKAQKQSRYRRNKR